MAVYHFVMSLGWRVVMLAVHPLTWLGVYEPSLYAAFRVLYHDEAAG